MITPILSHISAKKKLYLLSFVQLKKNLLFNSRFRQNVSMRFNSCFKLFFVFLIITTSNFSARIGMFFGNFDPIHKVHSKIIEESIIALNLDKLFVIPYFETDKKDGENYLVRTQLLRKAISEIPKMELFGSRRVAEIGRRSSLLSKSVSFFEKMVIDNIRYSEGWDQEYFLLVGTDEFLRIVDAHNLPGYEDPLNIVVVKRQGFDQTIPRRLTPFLGSKLFLLDFLAPRISSSQLREALSQGSLSNSEHLHSSVLKSIMARGFYGYPVVGQ